MKKFNFLENLLRRVSARSEKAVKASISDSQHAGSPQVTCSGVLSTVNRR